MIRIGVKGRILSGPYTGWYLLITYGGSWELEGKTEEQYYIYYSRSPDMKGGYNYLVPTFDSIQATLEQDGVIGQDESHIEWLESE